MNIETICVNFNNIQTKEQSQVDQVQNMCNYSKAKGLVTYHYRHSTSGSATVALSSTPRLSSFLNFYTLQTSSLVYPAFLRYCAIPITTIRGILTPPILPSKRTPVN